MNTVKSRSALVGPSILMAMLMMFAYATRAQEAAADKLGKLRVNGTVKVNGQPAATGDIVASGSTVAEGLMSC